jgi:hypothetical protein
MSVTSFFYEEDNQTFKIQSVLRPALSGLIVSVLDRLVVGNGTLASNLIFGLSVATGTLVGDVAATQISPMVGDWAMLSTDKSLSNRTSEIVGGATMSILVNDYLIGNPNYWSNNSPSVELLEKIGLIVVADTISAQFSDMLENKVKESMQSFA